MPANGVINGHQRPASRLAGLEPRNSEGQSWHTSRNIDRPVMPLELYRVDGESSASSSPGRSAGPRRLTHQIIPARLSDKIDNASKSSYDDLCPPEAQEMARQHRPIYKHSRPDPAACALHAGHATAKCVKAMSNRLRTSLEKILQHQEDRLRRVGEYSGLGSYGRGGFGGSGGTLQLHFDLK